MAASTDYFKKVGNPGTATTLSAPGYTAGATSITVASTTNWPTDTGVTFCMYEATTVGTETVMTAGTYNEYDGVVTGATSIGSLSHVAGSGTDRNYASGSGTVVTIMVTSGRENGIVDGLVVSHNQDGTLKNKVATLSKINGGSTDGVLLTDASGNVTGGKVTADKLDFASGIWWEEIGRISNTGQGSITLAGIPVRRYLKVLATVNVSTSMDIRIRFNNDSGNNYNWSFNLNGAGVVTASSTNLIQIASGTTTPNRLIELDILNIVNQNKVLKYAMSATSTASTTFGNWIGGGGWHNATYPITEIALMGSTGNLGNAQLIVLGHD